MRKNFLQFFIKICLIFYSNELIENIHADENCKKHLDTFYR